MTESTNTPLLPAPSPTFFAELAQAQAEFLPVRKNKVNPATHSKYADLQSILDAVRPALNAHGFFLFQRVACTDEYVNVETFLGHGTEQLSSGVFSVPFAGLKNGATNAAQALGSARTYACRYSLCSFLCVAADDDDDGNATAAPQTKPQQARPPQRPVVPQAMREASAAAAAKGTVAYKEYFNSLDLATRKLLIDTGVHSNNKAAAEMADTHGASHAE